MLTITTHSSSAPLPSRTAAKRCHQGDHPARLSLISRALPGTLVGILALAGSISGSDAVAASTADSKLQAQREAFRAVYPAAVSGDWGPAEAQRTLLEDYVLWPDIRAAYLRKRVKQPAAHDQINAFLEAEGSSGPARSLRYRYALQLAQTGNYSAFSTLYEQYYSDRGDAKLDCLALRADIKQGRTRDILERSKPLWLVSRSQDKACDPLFGYLKSTGQLDKPLYRQRYELAVEARNFSLARYLAKALDSATQQDARDWQAARDNPEGLITRVTRSSPDASQRAQIIYALQRLSYRQPELAATLWQDLRQRYTFTATQRLTIEQHTALWAVRRHSDMAEDLVAQLPAGDVTEEIHNWQLRSLLGQQSWSRLISSIDQLPAAEREQEVWQYWLGYALQQRNQKKRSRKILGELSKTRSYYGFLAADALDSPYQFEHQAIKADPEVQERLQQNKELNRATELFLVGQEANGRSQWSTVTAELDDMEKQQAALIAHELGWHSRAIATVALTGHYDDLLLRYPLPYRNKFERYAKSARIDNSWAYGIARSESLFMRDIRSSAGAIGLMQLMPETGKTTAKSLKVPYRGLATLTDPQSNIQLGTAYLGQMHRRFSDNPVLATAAYNAGPGNVRRWLAKTGDVDARIWIENIPFNETRKYVRRVLEADAIFHWRLTGDSKRISQALVRVVGTDNTRLADRGN